MRLRQEVDVAYVREPDQVNEDVSHLIREARPGRWIREVLGDLVVWNPLQLSRELAYLPGQSQSQVARGVELPPVAGVGEPA